MSSLVVVGPTAAALATVALFLLARPIMTGRMLWPALGAALAGGLLTIGLGTEYGIASVDYLIGVSSFAVPILVLLEAAAIGSGADRLGRWILLMVWGGIVFPVATLLPLQLTAACAGTDCELQDFGASLPLLVSSSAFVLLAWLPAGVVERPVPDPHSHRRAILSLVLLWVAVIIWLVQLEGAVDAFTPTILLAAVLGPLAGGVGWLITDRLRDVKRPVARSLVIGVIVGLAATLPGAVTVLLPWNLAVGALAGALGSLVSSSRGTANVGLATRWGAIVLVATGVGFLAPAISGDTLGILFVAHFDVLSVPIVSFAAVALGSIVLSAPAWVLLRRHASRELIPAEMRSDEAAAATDQETT